MGQAKFVTCFTYKCDSLYPWSAPDCALSETEEIQVMRNKMVENPNCSGQLICSVKGNRLFSGFGTACAGVRGREMLECF
jgi:hypothetical protein